MKIVFIFQITICCLFLNIQASIAQENLQINWINFNELHDSLQIKPKRVFINFYADWCSYCLTMEKTTFKDIKVIELLSRDYYAVRMNVESKDTVTFGEQVFVNKRIKRINAVHEIALMMASRKDKPFSLPAFVVLDEQFTPEARYFQFLDSDAMLSILLKR